MDSMAPSLLGLYLHGSLALDDFVAGKSDIDLCAMVCELRDDQRQRLIEAVSPDTISIEGGEFDIHGVTVEATRTTSLPPVRELWVANHPGWEFHVEGRAADHDMSLAFEMCRRHGRALRGPHVLEVFAPVNRTAMLTAAQREIEEWLSYEPINQWDSAVLSACRAWLLAEEDELGSKTAAGRWASSKGFSVVESAISHRAGTRVETPDQSAVREPLLHVHALLERELTDRVTTEP